MVGGSGSDRDRHRSGLPRHPSGGFRPGFRQHARRRHRLSTLPLAFIRGLHEREDLEGFAGAGLYDSVVVDEPELKPVAYADEPLIWDAEKRSSMIRKLAELAVAIEVEMKSPQDIEGCIVGGSTYILQSRPQVL